MALFALLLAFIVGGVASHGNAAHHAAGIHHFDDGGSGLPGGK